MDENSPEQLFNKMMEQHQKLTNMKPLNKGNMNQDFEVKRVLSELNTQMSRPHPSVNPSQGQCPECNLFHPPLGPGQKCPNAPVKIDGIDTNKISDFLIKIKDILTSQLEQKGIKNFDKFGGGMIMALMKYCEEYKDD